MKKFLVICAIFAVIFFAACDDGGKIDTKESDTNSNGDEISDGDDADSGDSQADDKTDTGNEEENDADSASEEDGADSGDSEAGDDADSGDSEPGGDTGSDDGDHPIIDVKDTPETVKCGNLPAVSSGVCEVKKGNGAKLIKGNILSGNKIFEGGEVLIGADGFIKCADCDCSAEASGATEINCPGATVTPALINGHDHLGYVHNKPGDWKEERFDHRHDWRKGKNGHTNIQKNITSGASVVQKQWAELRQLMSGTLAIAGSGGAKNGFMRNIDKNSSSDSALDPLGVDGMDVLYQTFPLSDSDGTTKDSGCDYKSIDPASVLKNDCYLPHVSEGINKAARNEFLCLTGKQSGGRDLAKENSAFVHSVGIIAEDGKELADSKTAIIWSVRTNISLYGNTAPVTMLRNQGVLIGLGTDWLPSGSMNILRELACVDYLNKNHFNNTFSDYEIWKMATVNNAAALRILDVTGSIRPGLVGDIVVFDAKGAENPYRAVIAGHEKKVSLVLRGGEVFYGDANVVTALDSANKCESISVCDVSKKVCVQESGKSLSELQSANSDQYKLFYCGTPDNEPTCVPKRTRSADEERPYSGPKEGDKDGDGIADSNDNCPDIFNPIRPVDGNKQADSDGDGLGDACDPCPLDKNSEECEAVNPFDEDGDGVLNGNDNCPFKYNPAQEDSDKNGKGDACEETPVIVTETTIYELKQNHVEQGSVVKVEGIVTAYKSNNFFMQVDPTDHDSTLKEKFSGIYVFKSPKDVKVGDKVLVTGTLTLYYDQFEIENVKSVEVVTANKGVPDFVTVDPAKVKDGGELKDAYNGVLVKVKDVNVTDGSGDHYKFDIADGLKVGDNFYSFETTPAIGTHFTSISGVLAYTFSHSKILPRYDSDLVSDKCASLNCDPSWSLGCDSARGCLPKEGFCSSKADCPAVDKVCDTEDTHTCIDGDPCEGVVCEDYEECKEETGTCALLDGRCTTNSDCGAAKQCNLATHECTEITSIIQNGGFEDWGTKVPTGWTDNTKDENDKQWTNISASNIIKETSNTHNGSAALKLNSVKDTKRFVSEAISLSKGKYSCEYYVKGTAEEGTSFYRNGSYYGNVPYETAGSSWKKRTYDFELTADAADFRFAFYVKNASSYVIIDDLFCTKK